MHVHPKLSNCPFSPSSPSGDHLNTRFKINIEGESWPRLWFLNTRNSHSPLIKWKVHVLRPTLQTLFFPMSISGQTQVTYKEGRGVVVGVGRKEKEKKAKSVECGFHWRLGGDADGRILSYITQQKCPDTILGCIRSLSLFLEHRDCVSIFHPIPLLWTTPLEASLCWEPRWPDCLSVCASGLEVLKSDVVQDQGDPGDAAAIVAFLSAALRPGSPRLHWSARVFSPSLDTQLQSHAGSSHRPLWTSVGFYISPSHGVPVSAGHTKLLEFASSSAPIFETLLPPAPSSSLYVLIA